MAARDGVLGRLLDPAERDASSSPCAAFAIEVPSLWMEEGARIELTLPRRLGCARCGGGGCGSCHNRGGFRAPEGDDGRHVTLTLPKAEPQPIRLRFADCFDGDTEIEQLVLDVTPSEEGPTQGVRRVDLGSTRPPASARWAPWAIGVLIVVALAVLAAFSRG